MFIVIIKYNMRFTHMFYLKMAASMKLTTKDAQHMLFSWNYDVGSADGDDDGDDVDFEHSKSSESEVVCTGCKLAIYRPIA